MNKYISQNLKTIPIIRLTFLSHQLKPSDIPRIRDFIAHSFPQHEELHNHNRNGGFRYVYPEIQYKFVKGQPAIIGHGTGLDILKEIFQKTGYLEINHRKIEINEKSVMLREEQVGMSDKFHRYRFISPWMALNQKNYEEYKLLDPIDKEQKLNRILWGNLRTLAHAFDIWLEDQESLKVSGHFRYRTVTFKGHAFMGFMGNCTTNFHIPEMLGVGKQVARGYGVVVTE